MKKLFCLAVLIFSGGALSLAFAQADSASALSRSEFTRLTNPPCKTRAIQTEGANSQQVCPGAVGYKLLLLDSDGRMSITIISPEGTRYPLEFWTTVTSHFSTVGNRAEWRFRNTGAQKSPTGIILPLDVREDANSDAVTLYLVVAKLDGKKVCVVKSLKRSEKALIEARRMADSPENATCQQLP